MSDLLEKSPEVFAAEVTSRLMSRRDFAAKARIGERKLDRLIAAGQIPVCRVGTSVLIDVVGANDTMATKK